MTYASTPSVCRKPSRRSACSSESPAHMSRNSAVVVQMSTPAGRSNASMSVTCGTRCANRSSCLNVVSSAVAPSNPGGSAVGEQYLERCTLRPIASVATARNGRCLQCLPAARASFSQLFACRSKGSSSPGPASAGAGSGFAKDGLNWMYTDSAGRAATDAPRPPRPARASYPSITLGWSTGSMPSSFPPSARYSAATGTSTEPR
mmetsp:Transcript_14958/g.63134  ORF Transcript_14958/g.63134 Transcript_14958/m.63134 type:complete len:205 (-) Transcript_14958:941-1555(-)